MNYRVIRADKSKDFLKNVVWTPTDITDQVVMPILDVARLDRALDSSSITLINDSPTAIKPFTKIIIITGDYDDILYRYTLTDSVEIITHGANKEYKHSLELIEPTKELERYVVDNTTVTNLLAYLYDDIITPSVDVSDWELNVDTTAGNIGEPRVDEQYSDDFRYYTKYIKGQSLQFVNLYVQLTWYFYSSPNVGPKENIAEMPLKEKKLIKPSGEIVDITPYIKLDEIGVYTIRQVNELLIKPGYQAPAGNNVTATHEWKIEVVKGYIPADKKPTKYTIKQVIDRLLEKVSSETTAPRLGLDKPIFHLDPNLDFLDQEFSPEFTFTQNTLFGVLEQIGNYIHAIPRLKPMAYVYQDHTDYWSNWDTITYDFLDEHKNEYVLGRNADNGEIDLDNTYDIIASDQAYDSENYATSFVTNVQNSFQTNKQDYISLVEPYDYGFVSTRTEDANFEISNDSAVIKTSRPIQRIVSLEVGVELTNNELKKEFFTLDITPRVFEQTDYNLLIDYATSETDILKTKSSAIYYTRGSNKISGLTYYPPKKLNIEYLSASRSIQHIISIMGRAEEPVKLQGLSLAECQNIKIKDLMFRIKYIPYYNFKAMQYKQYVGEASGNNTLFYNQQNAQQVDIESLGENVRGALMMTANKEFSITGYHDPNVGMAQMQVGDILHTVGTYGNESDFYAYQINREFIDNNTVKTTIQFSKNFNKWNDYIAVKKNYREWEISNRESIETNPISNQFCIVSDHTDYEKLEPEQKTELTKYLEKQKGFITSGVLEGIRQSLGVHKTGHIQLPIRWAYIKTKAYNEITQVDEDKTFFLPCACFGFGNSLILNFATQDNYSAGTTVKSGGEFPNAPSGGFDLDKFINLPTGGYDLENYVEYGNALGKVDTMEVAYGYASLKRDGFINTAKALSSSKEFYNLDANSSIKTENIAVDYRGEHPFIVNKDSRQQLNFTSQLNFVTDNPNIYISPNLVNKLIYVGASYKENSVKYVYFKESPDIFLDDFNIEKVQSITDLYFDEIYGGGDETTLAIKSYGASGEYVGVGLVDCNNETNTIDNNSKLLLYYKKDSKYKDKIYLKLRSRI